MEDKPTLKEYLRFRNMKYVRTFDGCYYAITNFNFTFPLTMIVTLLFAAPMFIFLYSNVPWYFSISHDILIVLLIFSLLTPRLTYRFEKFERLQEGSDRYQKASAKVYLGRLATVISIVLLILMYSMSSYSLSYLRSLTDTPEARCFINWTQTEDQRLDTSHGDITIVMPAELDETVHIKLKTYHTPYAPELMIDGKSVKDFEKDSRSSTYFFSKYYFSQDIYFTIPAADIHDGSVLTLTCGKWSYEWTFVSGSP